LIEDWPQHILSSATIIFDSNADYDTGNLNFGTREHLTTSPPSKVLHLTGTLPSATFAVARHAHESTMESGTYNYYVFGYFGSCHCFIFAPIDRDIGQAHDILGQFLIQIEEIPWGTRQPTTSSSTWRMFQREDALTGKGGGDVTRLMAPDQPRGNGPTAAQEGGCWAQFGPSVNSTRWYCSTAG
jgi:hypothetical protein